LKGRHQEKAAPDPLGNLKENLWSACIPILVGMAIGGLVLIALRLAGLRWIWAPVVGAPLTVLAWLIDWQAGLVCAAATITAGLGGRQLHHDDLERGGPEARRARETLTPWRWLWSLVRRRRTRRKRLSRAELAIGLTSRRTVCRIPFGSDRGVHGIVPGATGSGKTVTQAAIAQAYVLAGMGALVVDPKGDPFLRDVLQEVARHAGRRFIEWTPRGPTVYNPFARGGPTEITDKALAGHRWGDEYYRSITQRLLLKVLMTMQRAGEWPPTPKAIARCMDPDRLDELADRAGGEVADEVSAYVDSLSARQRADLAGGRDRMAVLVEGESAPWIDPGFGAGPSLDPGELLAAGDVGLFQLESDRYPVASQLLGAALVIDLVSLTADLRGKRLPGLIVIDEFSAVAAQEVSRLFGRARDAGLSILLGTQSLADLRAARPDDPTDTLTEQVLSNIEYAIVHRVSDPVSAERLAEFAGTRPEWATTRRISGAPGLAQVGEGTRTREREFHIHPDDFKGLRTGEAVVIQPTKTPPAELVRVWPPRSLEIDDERRAA
jgi:hypothetical protein